MFDWIKDLLGKKTIKPLTNREAEIVRLIKRKGKVTVNDFPAGYRLSHWIWKIRNKGVEVNTQEIIDYQQGYKRRIFEYKIKE
jgi:hypothetical protein